ncbi:MAG: tetratricopeptide repeat protein [Thaumarchaeota archaeon]|nr:tetratricopeptide repeat protein [Nitrososphaerota archaeon]
MAQKDKRKALVIAVSEYDESSNLENLPFCKNDGNEMLSFLKDSGYEIKNVDGLIGHVDGRLMQDLVYSFFEDNDIKSDETLLFYFSGHGVPGKDDFFLSSSNIDPSKPKMRGFSFADLNGEITNCRAKRVVVILDSCYAGSLGIGAKGNESAIATAAGNKLSATFKEGQGRCLLSSCMGFQESFATAERDHSFFTNYLLNGLRGAEGKSVDENGIVTPESLMNYIDHEIDNVKGNRPAQTPFRKIESAGKIMLASHPELAQAIKTKAISEKKSKIRKMLADLLGDGMISERILTSALSVSNLEPLHISGKEKQQWNLLERLLQREIQVGEFSESWLKLEWEQPQKPTSSEIQIDEKKETKQNSSELGNFIARGDHCISNNDYEGAIKWYDKALEIDPVDVYTIRSKGGALIHLGRYEEAIKLYTEGLKLVPDIKQGHSWLLNDRQEALEKLLSSQNEVGVQKDTSDIKPEPDKHVNQIEFMQKELENLKSEKQAGHEQNSSKLGNFIAQGDGLKNLGKYDEAIKCYDLALELVPNHVDTLYKKAYSLSNLGKQNEAIKCYDLILEIKPDAINALYEKASICFYSLKKYDEAIKCYDKILKVDNNHLGALTNKGQILKNLGKYDEAIKCYDDVLEIKPTDYSALYQRNVLVSDLEQMKKLSVNHTTPKSKTPSYWYEQFPVGRWSVSETNEQFTKTYKTFTLVLYSNHVFAKEGASGYWTYDGKRLIFKSNSGKFNMEGKLIRIDPDYPRAYFKGKHDITNYLFSYIDSK